MFDLTNICKKLSLLLEESEESPPIFQPWQDSVKAASKPLDVDCEVIALLNNEMDDVGPSHMSDAPEK